MQLNTLHWHRTDLKGECLSFKKSAIFRKGTQNHYQFSKGQQSILASFKSTTVSKYYCLPGRFMLANIVNLVYKSQSTYKWYRLCSLCSFLTSSGVQSSYRVGRAVAHEWTQHDLNQLKKVAPMNKSLNSSKGLRVEKACYNKSQIYLNLCQVFTSIGSAFVFARLNKKTRI